MLSLLTSILDAVAKPAHSGEMFADGIRIAGLVVLAAHHIFESSPPALIKSSARTSRPARTALPRPSKSPFLTYLTLNQRFQNLSKQLKSSKRVNRIPPKT
jgi:hypothetical protein